MNPELVEQVLGVVELIPVGNVVSYGDIAELVGTTPRLVGRILALHGAAVCWWRVTNAKGELPSFLLPQAIAHWQEEKIMIKNTALGCSFRSCHADLMALAAAWEDLASTMSCGEAPCRL